MHKILIILSTFFISCSQQQEIGNSLTVITFDKTKESHWNVDSLECKFIPLETTDDCLLGSIVNIQFYNNHIFIQMETKMVEFLNSIIKVNILHK